MTYHQRLSAYLAIFFFLSGILLFVQPNNKKTISLENNKVITKQNTPNDSRVLASGDYSGGNVSSDISWTQNSWNGSESSDIYTIPFNGSKGGWNKFTSSHNVTLDSNGITDDGSKTGELVSSVFDMGSRRFGGFNIDSGGTINWRSSPTLDGLQAASWSPTCNPANRYFQYKVSFQYSQTGRIQNVQLVPEYTTLWGYIKDTSGNKISGVTITTNGISATTGSGSWLGFYYLSFDYKAENNLAYNLTASKSGYKSQTKTISVKAAINCNLEAITDFNLEKNPTSGSGSSTPPPPAPITETNVPIKKTILPAGFTKVGSSTTDLTKVVDLTKVSNLTLDIPSKNKIVFAEDVDLSSQAAADIFSKLDTYVKADKLGVVEVDSKNAPLLNKKAHVVMYNLPHKTTPKILVDGKEDPKVVSNINYISGTLNFDVAHFTKFEAVANTPQITTQQKTINLTFIIEAILVASLVMILFVAYSLKKSGKIFKTKSA